MKHDSPTTEILAEIERLQEIQKRSSPKSEEWQSASSSLQPLFAEMARREPVLRPGARVFHGSREATVLALDAEPDAQVWIIYADDPDEGAFVHRDDLSALCWPCDRAPATIDAIDDSEPVRVCQRCFNHSADGDGV